jgi:hypothetical protein
VGRHIGAVVAVIRMAARMRDAVMPFSRQNGQFSCGVADVAATVKVAAFRSEEKPTATVGGMRWARQ